MSQGGRIRRLQDLGTEQISDEYNVMKEEMVGEYSHQQGSQQENINNEKAQMMARIVQGVVMGIRMLKNDPEKNFRIERLKALGATTFAGTTASADAETWVKMLEKCFDVIGCPEDRKVRLATFLLQEGASDWWEFMKVGRSEAEITSWSEFKKVFYEAYYPQSYRDAKRNEFLKLVQGSMTVAQYQKKYIELCKYATTIIKDEIDKCRRFQDGLRWRFELSHLMGSGKILED